MENEPFSNPLAPPSAIPARSQQDTTSSSGQPLTNADFRKILMTPRAVGSGGGSSGVPGSVRGSIRSKHSSFSQKADNSSENSKKKKKFYESIRKQDDELLTELAKRYRDRAKERRDGSNDDYGKAADLMANTAYHAVGPGNFDMDAAERKRQLIQESKYLGGDMEHTHLVKGLDYALLHKVKTEIQTKDEEEEYIRMKREQEALKEEEQKKKNQSGLTNVADITFSGNDRYAVKSKIAENILKSVFNTKLPERNELFLQGRMAYQYDLVDEFPDTDIPTTIIRSKAECPNLDAYNSSTNQIVINKLIQIFQGGVAKKAKKLKFESRNNDEMASSSSSKHPEKAKGDSIYDDIGDYVPTIKSRHRSSSHSRDGRGDRDYREASRHSYFETKECEQESRELDRRTSGQKALELAAKVVGGFAASSDLPQMKGERKRKSTYQAEPDSYAECYPGAPENDDAIIDSDDEVDYSKMDTGTKKSAVNRWDFDSAEEYSNYMSNKEATPKAAFHYGVKLAEGRGSKKAPSKKEENAKLNRDLQKINAIIAKRKEGGRDMGMPSYTPDKKARH